MCLFVSWLLLCLLWRKEISCSLGGDLNLAEAQARSSGKQEPDSHTCVSQDHSRRHGPGMWDKNYFGFQQTPQGGKGCDSSKGDLDGTEEQKRPCYSPMGSS